MTSQTGKQIITIYIFPYTIYTYTYYSRSKGNHTMKFGNLTRETTFLKNHTQNVVKKLVTAPFTKIKIERMSGSTV